MNRTCPLLLAGLIVASFSLLHAEDQRPAKPNVLVLLTDDLGWQDVDCYDIDEKNSYTTPNIDALATKGVKFWRAYSPAPTCAPSRCAIVSGVHPARAQKTHIKGGTPPQPYSNDTRMMSPWFSARTPVGDYTIASAMKDFGYTTGHVGKWHISYSEPKATELGFDVSLGSRVSKALMKNRLADFATNDPDDPYRLDENGFPYNQTTENALGFIKDHKASPFFLYYATWLVHAPIQTRSEMLLDKYAKQIGINPRNKKEFSGATTGQCNPFYAAMVEELDYNLGRVLDYLENTEDPRWTGHKLIENTYVIFTSDNGGCEGKEGERYTDNYPLDMGKTSVKEGGTRVPFIVTGPGIPKGVESDVMINGLDIYPTVLSMVGADQPEKNLDGLDLFTLLTTDPTDPALVKTKSGEVRNSMMWHFPHDALESSLIVDDYKLIRNYDYINNPDKEQYELYQLYQTTEEGSKRVDLEEAENLAATMPEKTKSLDELLSRQLADMKASYPSYNPDAVQDLPGKDLVPGIVSHKLRGDQLKVFYRDNGAKLAEANLIYSTHDSKSAYQEWFSIPMSIKESGPSVTAMLPEGTKYCFVNLIDENNFLVSYPEVGTIKGRKKKSSFSDKAIKIEAK
ncbi:MAG: sulfatase [Verrucomicrobiales bacterium]|nr:sulfatase [Verrucomicrobiales bacterium]